MHRVEPTSVVPTRASILTSPLLLLAALPAVKNETLAPFVGTVRVSVAVERSRGAGRNLTAPPPAAEALESLTLAVSPVERRRIGHADSAWSRGPRQELRSRNRAVVDFHLDNHRHASQRLATERPSRQSDIGSIELPTLSENCLASPTNRRRNHFPWRRRSACAEPVLQPFGENRKSFKLNIRRDERKTPSSPVASPNAMVRVLKAISEWQLRRTKPKGPVLRPGLSYPVLIDRKRYAASSSTTASSASSAGFGPRRGPLASAPSISLIASVSVQRCTAEISRDSRSRAAS